MSSADAGAAAGTGKVHYFPILGAALALRLLMVFSVAKGAPRFWFFNQASEYGCLAQSMLSGHGYASPFCGSTGPSAFLAPGYPVLVAAVFHVFGSYSGASAAALIALQTLFCELTVFVLLLLAKRVLGSKSANLAGTLYAISPPALGLPILFWETSLSMLLLTGVVLAAIYCVDHPKNRNWLALGVFCASAMFVNPSLFLTFGAILGWAMWQSKARALRGPMLALAIWGTLYSVWPVRNLVQMHAFVPMRTNLGYELWQGNRPGSNGTFSFSLHPNTSNEEYSRYAKLGELAFMHEKSELAIAAIQADRMRFLKLSAGRFLKFWADTAEYRFSPILTLNVAFTSIVSVFGLAMLVRRNPVFGYLLAIPFVVQPAPYYLTHADFRFRLLLDPLAIMMTAFVMREGIMLFRAHRQRTKRKSSVQAHELPASIQANGNAF